MTDVAKQPRAPRKPSGGPRKGAGRKPLYNEPSKQIRCPESLIDDVQKFIKERLIHGVRMQGTARADVEVGKPTGGKVPASAGAITKRGKQR